MIDAFQVTLLATTLLCGLVAGFVFAFAVVVMPGIRTLSDGEFLRAFQVMDRVIQGNQPVFMLVWVGSVVGVLVSAGLGWGRLDAGGRVLLGAATLVYLVGVQLPTAVINIPLNNAMQALELAELDAAALAAARRSFESRWNRSNTARTVLATLVSLMLMTLLIRL